MLEAIKTVLRPENANNRFTLLEFLIADGSVVVLLGSLSFWIQLTMMLVMQSSISALFAVICYKFIVKKRGSGSSYLIGFGFVVPAAIMIPLYFIEYSSVTNIAVMIGATALAIVVPFNCIEAMYGTSEKGVEISLQRYLSYYCTIIPLDRDPKTGAPVRQTAKELADQGRAFLLHVAIIMVYLMVLVHCNFEPFPSPRERDAFLPPSLWQVFHWGHLLNNLAIAMFTTECIETGTGGVGFGVSCITGCKVIKVMDSPMTASQSPSEFWGRRWNLMLHGSFKRGVVKPLRLHKVSRGAAVLVTFVVSGLLHEYVCWVIQSKYRLYPEIADPYEVAIGRHLLFFAWNGCLVLLDKLVSGLSLFQWVKTTLPKPVVTALVLLTVLPISHWFTDEYIRSGFFSDYSMGFPLIIFV